MGNGSARFSVGGTRPRVSRGGACGYRCYRSPVISLACCGDSDTWPSACSVRSVLFRCSSQVFWVGLPGLDVLGQHSGKSPRGPDMGEEPGPMAHGQHWSVVVCSSCLIAFECGPSIRVDVIQAIRHHQRIYQRLIHPDQTQSHPVR